MMWLDFSGKRHNVGGCGELQVECGGDAFRHRPDIGILDVTPVFSQVNGDPVGTSPLAQQRCFHRIGLVGPARLPDCRHMVYVDVQPHSLSLPCP
jgi:hypothetical protein